MFGTLSMNNWGVSYVKDGITYYVSDVEPALNKIVWSTRKEKAKRFNAHGEAVQCVENIKQTRKKLNVSVNQL